MHLNLQSLSHLCCECCDRSRMLRIPCCFRCFLFFCFFFLFFFFSYGCEWGPVIRWILVSVTVLYFIHIYGWIQRLWHYWRPRTPSVWQGLVRLPSRFAGGSIGFQFPTLVVGDPGMLLVAILADWGFLPPLLTFRLLISVRFSTSFSFSISGLFPCIGGLAPSPIYVGLVTSMVRTVREWMN